MLNSLRGSRTLILLVIANLPDVAMSISRIVSGIWGENVAADMLKIVTGIVSVFTVLVRLVPQDPAPAVKE